MKLKDYREKRMQDPEMQAAYEKLRPKLELGRQILELRLERGWTQKELAKKAGTKQANISRLENALLNPSIEMLQKVADALGSELNVQIGPKKETIPSAEETTTVAEASTVPRASLPTCEISNVQPGRGSVSARAVSAYVDGCFVHYMASVSAKIQTAEQSDTAHMPQVSPEESSTLSKWLMADPVESPTPETESVMIKRFHA